MKSVSKNWPVLLAEAGRLGEASLGSCKAGWGGVGRGAARARVGAAAADTHAGEAENWQPQQQPTPMSPSLP